MSVDFTPKQNEYKRLSQFRHWCQKVLPLVYDDSISYYELLCKLTGYLNDTISNMNYMGEDITNLFETYKMLLDWVNSYFDNLDVQEEINNKLDLMSENGTLSTLFSLYYSRTYNVVADMKNDRLLTVGMTVTTKGYYSVNDGGNSTYIIVEQKDTSTWCEEIVNGKYAVLLSPLSFKRIGMLENENNDSVMGKLINLIVSNENTKQYDVFVDGTNFEFTVIDFTNVFNLYLHAVPCGRGHYDYGVPNITCTNILFSNSFNNTLFGLSINGVATESVVKYRGTCRQNYINKCRITGGNIGVEIGLTSEASDVANIVIENNFIEGNNYGISCNSGNGRVQCRSNFLINKINNYVIYGGLNILDGNTGDIFPDYTNFEGEIKVHGGGVTVIGHDSDVFQGYFMWGTPSLPVTIVGSRHYDSSMTEEKVPYSIHLYGSTEVNITGCYFYNHIKIDVGSNYHASVIDTFLINGSISGTGRIVRINSESGSVGCIRNCTPVYEHTAMSLDNPNGEIAEFTRNGWYSSLHKIQNGVLINNNKYVDITGDEKVINDELPVSSFEVSGLLRFMQVIGGVNTNVFKVALDSVYPYIEVGDIKVYFTDKVQSLVMAEGGDLSFTGNTASPYILSYNGNEWVTVV